MTLGRADVERPSALRGVLRLRRGQNVHAVIALVALDDVDLDGRGFAHVRDSVRGVAHFVATHLNPIALADDAQVWAAAPVGREREPAWERLRDEIHQDTWSVPKSLWIPNDQMDPSAFMQQSILAEPWDTEESAHAESLDLLDRFAKKLGGKGGAWPRQRVRALLDCLMDDAEPSAVAGALVRLAEDA